MKILDTFWTPKINVHIVECDCGHQNPMRADVWYINCSRCGKKISMKELRGEEE